MKPSSPEIRQMLPRDKNEPGKKGRKKEPELPIFQGRGGEWRLTTAERKRILLNNIYGVDIDRQAVEVTKLSLLLKVLEGENDETISKQLKLFQERALPDLGNNIKCGNSLIGWDILEDNPNLTQEEIERINPFDWEKEFPTIFQNGGFDIVIGNPPYIGFHGFKSEKDYLKELYLSATGKFDLYLPFIEKGLKLIKNRGFFGYICPTNFTKRDHGRALRNYIRTSHTIIQIVDFEDVQIFQGVLNYTGIFIIKSARPSQNHKISYKSRSLDSADFYVAQENLPSDDVWVFRPDLLDLFIKKIINQNTAPLSDLCLGISEGIVTGENSVFLLQKNYASELKLEKEIIKECIRGRQIRRYKIEEMDEVVIYPYYLAEGKTKVLSERDLKRYANTADYLLSRRPDLSGRPYFEKSPKAWYELWCQRNLSMLATKKIVVPELSDSNRFALADEQQFYGDTVCGITLLPNTPENILYILGILNSKLIEYYYKKTTVPKANGFYIYKTMFLKKIPIKRIDFLDITEAERHNRIVSLVNQMLHLNKQTHEARTPHEQTSLQRQIEATDRQIDALVYELYGLTEEEIKIVEGAED